jgi:2'-5' RNA ligase
MKYFIGYLISDEASEWHINITKKISEEFNTWKIYEKIPPHITIFYPEGVEDITDIRNYIKDWAEKNKITGNFYINGFDHFDDKVVFAKIDADESVIKTVNNLREGIRTISNIKNEAFPNWHPHSTLINKISPEEINKVLKYAYELDKPSFRLPFNNITIFKYTDDQKWVVEETFELSQF